MRSLSIVAANSCRLKSYVGTPSTRTRPDGFRVKIRYDPLMERSVGGFFIGNAVGDIGLSAINVAVPIVMVMQCLGTGIGMGGSVWYSINNASQKADEAKKYLACTLWLLIISSLVLTTVCLLFTEELISLLGAEGRILEYGIPYIKVMAFGAIFQVFATGVVPIIRNNGG